MLQGVFQTAQWARHTWQGLADMDDNTRVVIVDDDPEVLQSFADLLRHEGLEVHTAANAAEAVTTVRQTSPHCVLLDILLPDLDGRELAQQLRKEHGCALVLIAVTGGGAQVDSLDASMKAIDHVLRKPVDIAALRKLLCR